MNRRQKEIQQQFLDNEKKVFKDLDGVYKNALNDINQKIELLLARQDADMQHVVYQVEYQKALKTQVQSILETLQTNEFETVSKYLTKSYEDGFIGTMYDLHGQGIPLVFPLDQEQIVAAIRLESKLKSDLYTEMGHDIRELRKQIAAEISRGISTGLMYQDITRNIANYANIPKGRAKNIVRTDGHRIQIKATSDAQHKAKEKGADIVKQWDATMDGGTRPKHRELDGQIRELDEPFEVGGDKVMMPGDFGDPADDCNCRCALLQRARWALGNNYTKWSEDAPIIISDDGTTQFTIIEAKNYKEFQKKYLKAAEQVRSNVQKMNDKDALENSVKSGTMKLNNKEVRAKYLEEVSKIKDGIDSSLPMEEQAKLAFEARNKVRTEARNMMADQETRKKLDELKPNKTFEELVKSKMERKGMTREEAIKDVYDTATKTNADVNKELGLGGE